MDFETVDIEIRVTLRLMSVQNVHTGIFKVVELKLKLIQVC